MPTPEEIRESYQQRYHNNPTESFFITKSIECEELDSDFTIEEVQYCIRKLSNNKAAGSDAIPNEV